MKTLNFALWRRDWSISQWSDSMAAVSKFSKTEVIGESISVLFSGHELELMRQKLSRAIMARDMHYFRTSFVSKDGVETDVLLYFTLREHEIIVSGGMIEDTELSAFDDASVKIGVDVDGCVTEWDEVAEAATGFSLRALQGKDLVECVMMEEFGAREFMTRRLQDALKGEFGRPFAVPIFTQDSRLRIIQLQAKPRHENRCTAGVMFLGPGAVVFSPDPEEKRTPLEEKQPCKCTTEEKRTALEERNLYRSTTEGTLSTMCPSEDVLPMMHPR
eukprot:TRINITY_DN8945_c0_g1_i3.p1 TRINITY_DN8945_c0_g1~~TRINITY_DN8945_c0_g1_i3.p1  ORF type:complete len:274 (-),score=46.67 TRINITY_DN8945_c0_g1_i3:43-864(-)